MTKSKKTKSNLSTKLVRCRKSHQHFICELQLSKTKKITFLKLLLIPSKQNKHRPHLIRKSGLVSVAIMLVVLQFAYNFIITGQPKILGYATNVSSAQVVAEVNKARESDGLNDLHPNDLLNQAASLKAQDMFTQNYWSHNSPNGVQPWHWFEKAGYDYANAGENLAKDFKTSSGVSNAWMNSKTHRDNVLNSKYKDVGVATVNGVLDGKETTLVVAMFGTTKSQSTAFSSTDGKILGSTTSLSSNILTSPAQIGAIKSPISIVTILVLLLITVVAILSHWDYIKIPRKLRKSWYKHHALYVALIALLTASYVLYVLTAGSI